MKPEQLSADFAGNVLRSVDGVRRRRAVAAVLSVVALVGVGLWPLVRPSPAPGPALVAADFAWLEEVGSPPSSPGTRPFLDDDEGAAGEVTESL